MHMRKFPWYTPESTYVCTVCRPAGKHTQGHTRLLSQNDRATNTRQNVTDILTLYHPVWLTHSCFSTYTLPWRYTLHKTPRHTHTLRLHSLGACLVSLGTTGSHSSNLLTCYSCRLWAERAQTVLQTRAQWLSARPPQDQEGLQLRSHHAGQSPQHTTADGSGHVYQRDRAQRYWSLLKWRSQIFSSTCGLQ